MKQFLDTEGPVSGLGTSPRLTLTRVGQTNPLFQMVYVISATVCVIILRARLAATQINQAVIYSTRMQLTLRRL